MRRPIAAAAVLIVAALNMPGYTLGNGSQRPDRLGGATEGAVRHGLAA